MSHRSCSLGAAAAAAAVLLAASPASAAPKPKLGRTVVLRPISGDVSYRAPGHRAVPLLRAKALPLGLVVDASRGTARWPGAR